MIAKINKALDLNKLFQDQANGKLLKKHIKFPLYAGIKYDGNYVVVIKEAQGMVEYITSGGHIYTNDAPTIFDLSNIPPAVYIAERIANTGELGDRRNCSLRGTRGSQTAYNHKYKVHDILIHEEYEADKSFRPYHERREIVRDLFPNNWAADMAIHTMKHLDDYLDQVTKRHWEGLMLKDPEWYWENTKSRKVTLVKYKKRPTVDLLVVGVNEGTKKYTGMIGSLTLKDSKGRLVDVGSGISDEQRLLDPSVFLGKVVEVFYEQILDTYIQPTFGSEYEGVLIRHDKTKEDID